MKLASLRDGSRDGLLLVVSRDLSRAVPVPGVAATLQAALDDWARARPRLEQASIELESGRAAGAFPFRPTEVLSPLPRAHHWVDGSAYVNHVELVRKARGAEMPPSFWTDPLVYQGGSDDFLAPCADARRHVQLLMLVNDWSLRNLIPAELAKGFGFYQSKPATAFSPVAVTPDELGADWDGGKVLLPLVSHVNGERLGHPEAGVDMTFDFPRLIEHVTVTRRLGTGTIVGSGTVSNYDRSRGSSCLAERRMLEQLEHGRPITPFLRYGDRVRIEMFDRSGASIFGAIDQRVVPAR